MDQKPVTHQAPPVGFTQPPAYDQYQNFPPDYQGQPPQGQPQVITGE